MNGYSFNRFAFDIKTEITYLKGVGPQRAKALNKIGIYTFYDFMTHYPRLYEDEREVTPISDLEVDETAIVIGHISNIKSRTVRNNLTIINAILEDATDYLQLTWFNQAYLLNKLKTGMRLIVKGKVSESYGRSDIFSMNVISFDVLDENENPQLGIFPIYPSTSNLTQKFFRTSMRNLLARMPELQEFMPPDIIAENELMPYDRAIRSIHFPRSRLDIDEARYRLAFNELFLIQYGLMLLKKQSQDEELGIKHKRNGKLMKQALESLPFKLTKDQQMVFNEVKNDMQKQTPMRRLIQGDVGSGKTAVAMLALVKTVENGYQGAFMAPTEILAAQHYEKFVKQLEPLGIKIGFLSAQVTRTAKKREEAYEKIASGKFDIVIGTHSLIEEGVPFKNLGLVVTDEQHRFGVAQRSRLEKKSELTPDILVMTATPIPRTMTLTVYGDLDISVIKELPPGRKPVDTKVRHKAGRRQVYNFVKNEILNGRQAYVVCPLIEHSESEKMQEVASAEEIFDELRYGIFRGINCALLHGKMKPKEKDEIMQNFRENKIQLLVSTTVVEVGVDVPNASVMVIEHAERFGLATLHQLRGRVGRGSEKSYCILISDTKADTGKARLNLMETTSDGFKLAEEDLRLRGPGQFFGEAQHGLPDLKIADVFRDVDVLIKARRAAENFVENENSPAQIENLKSNLAMAYGSRFKQITET